MMSRFSNGPAFLLCISLQEGDQPIHLFRCVECMDNDPQTLAAFGNGGIQDGANVQTGLLQAFGQPSHRCIAGHDDHLDRGGTFQPLVTDSCLLKSFNGSLQPETFLVKTGE